MGAYIMSQDHDDHIQSLAQHQFDDGEDDGYCPKCETTPDAETGLCDCHFIKLAADRLEDQWRGNGS